MSCSFLLHCTRNAEHTYKWNCENASVPSACPILSGLACMRTLGKTYEVGIPHSDGILHADFAHEETVHPPKRELHELDVLCVQMRCQRCCTDQEGELRPGRRILGVDVPSIRATSSAMRLTLL